MNIWSIRGSLATGLRSFEEIAVNPSSLMHRWTYGFFIRAKVQRGARYCLIRCFISGKRVDKEEVSDDSWHYGLNLVRENSDLKRPVARRLSVITTSLFESWTYGQLKYLPSVDRVPKNVSAYVHPNKTVNVGVRASANSRARFDSQTVVDAYFSASV